MSLSILTDYEIKNTGEKNDEKTHHEDDFY
jgi:hypothetical protein